MNIDTLEIINKVCNRVATSKKIKDPINDLKKWNTMYYFEKKMNEWAELYKEETGNSLFDTLEEYDAICDIKRFKSIKQRMIYQLVLALKKQNNDIFND